MPLVPFVPDPQRYENVFVMQVGSGLMTRYRGSAYQNGSGFFPQILKNLFKKIGSFVQPMLAKAAPHAKAALNAAIPHLREAADGTIKEISSQAQQAIARRLVPQEGSGKRKRGIIKKKKRTSNIAPYNIPDSF